MSVNYCNSSELYERLLCQLIENQSDRVFLVDEKGIIKLINISAVDWLKRKKEELINTPIYDLLPMPEKLDDILRNDTVVDQEKEIDGILYRIRIIPVRPELSSSHGAFIIFRDISDFRRLQEANRELDAVIEACSDSVYVTDGEGYTLRINSACERITGLQKDKVIGMNMKDVVAQGMISNSCTLEVLKKKSKVTVLQYVKDGKVVIVTGTPLFDDSGKIWRVVSSTRDITELNRLKSQLEEERRWKDQYFSELVTTKIERITSGDGAFIAKSPAMQKVVELAMRVARTESTVLVRGDSGVGKEVITRFIHQNSPRRKKAFMKINCAAIPENLLESELFGYEPGAFTGAMKKGKNGLVELADGGTLFLDEIGEMPLSLQVKLLQLIQEHTFIRVGGTSTKKVDIRIIAATNRNLEELVAEGEFREDLYYRINVIPIVIPPLQERPEDIVPLIRKFTTKFNSKHKLNKRFTPEAVNIMAKYQWPGNVRELENIVEQMIVITPEDIISPDHLPCYIKNKAKEEDRKKVTVSGVMQLQEAIEEVEKQLLFSTYDKCHNTYDTAEVLGVSQPTVVRKLKKYRE